MTGSRGAASRGRARKVAGGTKPTAVIFGATVAGLAAAQRLAERGFGVTVLRSPGGRALPEDLEGVGWAKPRDIAPFAVDGPRFPPAAPVPAAAVAPALLNHFRHLRSLLADIPSGKGQASVLSTAAPRTWLPSQSESEPWVAFAVARPETVEQLIESTKHFLAAGYTLQDGQTFWARVLRFLTSSDLRRRAECEDVSMADYLRGQRPAASPKFNYSARFADELQRLPELSLGIRPVRDEARAALGWYAQWLASAALGPEPGAFEFAAGVADGWINPWLRHLRRLNVQIVDGELDHLRLQRDGRDRNGRRPRSVGATSVGRLQAVLVAGGAPAVRALVDKAQYLIVATAAVEAERACAALPSPFPRADAANDITDQLRGFTTGRGSHTRWRTSTAVELFLPNAAPASGPSPTTKSQPRLRPALDLPGPLLVVGSPWQLVARQQRVFSGGASSSGPRESPYAAVLNVEVQAWDVPAPTTGKTAATCDDGELAREVWSQLAPALPRTCRRRPPLWFRIITPAGVHRPGTAAAPEKLNLLPNDWVNRPGPPPRPQAETEAQDSPTAGAEVPKEPVARLHAERLVFAGDYLKTLTRHQGPEAACESAFHAVNAVLEHTSRSGRHAVQPPCAIWDPEAHEPAIFTAARTLDAGLCAMGLPHAFELTGLDGWLGIASWLSNLDPATEPFLKTVMNLVGTFPGAAPASAAHADAPSHRATSFQEMGLSLLRRMREALEKKAAQAG